jgi:hypothetical protein
VSQPAKSGQPVRIRTARLMKPLLWGLIIPLSCAFVLDRLLGIAPWVTLFGIVVCIPLTSVMVSRVALTELNNVIAVVAPEETVASEPQPKELQDGNSVAGRAP